MALFNGVKVFTATTASDRNALGTRLTEWLAQRPGIRIVDKRVMQSSDEQFHCVSIVVFYLEALP